MAFPSMIPGFPVQVYPRASSAAPFTDGTLQDCRDNQGPQAPPCPPSIHLAPYTAPMVTPIVALVMPNYVYPPVATGLPTPQPVYHAETGGFPTQTQPFSQAAFSGQVPFTALPSFNVQNQFNSQNHSAPQTGYLTPSFYFSPSSETPKAPAEGQSRSSTPQSGGCGGPASPPMFQSRCSSPLNLLELELSVDRQDGTALSSGGQGNNMTEKEKGAIGTQTKERELKQVNEETKSLFGGFSSFYLFLSFSSLKLPNVYDRFTPPVTFSNCRDKNIDALLNFIIVGCLNSCRHAIACSSKKMYTSLSQSGLRNIGTVIPPHYSPC